MTSMNRYLLGDLQQTFYDVMESEGYDPDNLLKNFMIDCLRDCDWILEPVKTGFKLPRNISKIKNMNKFRIQKYRNGKCVNYGYYSSLDDAIAVKEKLEECDWDKSKLDEIRRSLKIRKKYKNYSHIKREDKYRVRKSLDGKMIYYGDYDTEEMAKQIVEELEKVDWDKSKLYGIVQSITEKEELKGVV